MPVTYPIETPKPYLIMQSDNYQQLDPDSVLADVIRGQLNNNFFVIHQP